MKLKVIKTVEFNDLEQEAYKGLKNFEYLHSFDKIFSCTGRDFYCDETCPFYGDREIDGIHCLIINAHSNIKRLNRKLEDLGVV